MSNTEKLIKQLNENKEIRKLQEKVVKPAVRIQQVKNNLIILAHDLLVSKKINDSLYRKIQLLTYSKTTVNCYPNPTKGKATITAEDDIERVVVFNTAGQVVFAESLTVKSKEINLDFSQFAQQKQAGLSVYFVRIETQHGMITRSVVVEP